MISAVSSQCSTQKLVVATFAAVSAVALTIFSVYFHALPPAGGISVLTLTASLTVGFVAYAIYSCRNCETIGQKQQLIIAGCSDGSLRVVEKESRKVTVLAGESAVTSVLTWSETEVLAGYESGAIILWDIENGEQTKIFSGHEGRVNCLAQYSETQFVSGSSELRLWNLENENVKNLEIKDNKSVTSVMKYQTHEVLFATSGGGLNVWNFEKGSSKDKINSEFKHLIRDNSGHLIYEKDCGVKVSTLNAIYSVTEIGRHSFPVTALYLLDNGNVLSSDEKGWLKIWNIESGFVAMTWWQRAHISALMQDADGAVIAASGTQLGVWSGNEVTELVDLGAIVSCLTS